MHIEHEAFVESYTGAFREFLESRQLVPHGDWLSYWQGKSATQAAQLLAQRMRDDPPIKDSTFKTRRVSFRLDHITYEELQVVRFTRWSDGASGSSNALSAKWKDLYFVATNMPRCGPDNEEKQCVHSTVL